MRKYTPAQILGFFLSFLVPPLGVWFAEGFRTDFWINVGLCFFGLLPGSIHSTYIWIVWVERKWETHHGLDVTRHPFLIFSKEFEMRSRWKGSGQDGVFGYIDDNVGDAQGRPDAVEGLLDPRQVQPVPYTDDES